MGPGPGPSYRHVGALTTHQEPTSPLAHSEVLAFLLTPVSATFPISLPQLDTLLFSSTQTYSLHQGQIQAPSLPPHPIPWLLEAFPVVHLSVGRTHK